jgi:peptidoglycan-N-acetylglucosamine deacetylase
MPLTRNGFPVTLTFDLDAETLWTGGRPERATMPITLSQGTYGPNVAMGRILDLLDRYSAKATFFTPGETVLRHPGTIEELLARGHELAHHGHTHAYLPKLSADQEREEMERGIEAIQRASGRRPAGYRAPHGEFGTATLDLIHRSGFAYSSNYQDDDSPYLHVMDGRTTNVVELPWMWAMDDAPYFLFSAHHFARSMQPPSVVQEIWQAEFDAMYDEDRMFMLVMHPQIIGRPSRLAMLERLLEHIASRTDVWLARCDEVADALRRELMVRDQKRDMRRP